MNYTDIGANLCAPTFAGDQAAVIERARNACVTRILITASDVAESEQALLLCRRYPGVLFATAGVHPHQAKAAKAGFADKLKHYLSQEEVKAVGETGLDYNRNYSSPEDQERVFETQLELAAQTGLPLFLHERDASLRLQEILHTWYTKISGGVLHCFTGTYDNLRQYLDLGLYIGITGWICDPKRGADLKNIVAHIPDDRLLIETDAPYLVPKTLSPVPKRNEPAWLPEVAKIVAQCRQQEVAEVAALSFTNAERLFKLASC